MWVAGARSRTESGAELGQRAGVPGRRGRCRPAAQGWRSVDAAASRGRLGRGPGQAGAGAREKSGRGADLLPSRSCQARPGEAGGRRPGVRGARVCIAGERVQPPASLLLWPTGLSPPGFLIVPELSSCVGS